MRLPKSRKAISESVCAERGDDLLIQPKRAAEYPRRAFFFCARCKLFMYYLQSYSSRFTPQPQLLPQPQQQSRRMMMIISQHPQPPPLPQHPQSRSMMIIQLTQSQPQPQPPPKLNPFIVLTSFKIFRCPHSGSPYTTHYEVLLIYVTSGIHLPNIVLSGIIGV